MQEIAVQGTDLKLVLLHPKENKIPSMEEIKADAAKFIYLIVEGN